MVDDTKFCISILKIQNECDNRPLKILIEPHLDLYVLPPGKMCDVLYTTRTDNTVPQKTLAIAHREDCLVVYAPGPYAPELRVDGKLLNNIWGKMSENLSSMPN